MKIKMALVGLALTGLVASSAAQVPAPKAEQDAHTAYAGPVESVGTAGAAGVLTRLLKTKAVRGAVVVVVVEAVDLVADLLGVQEGVRVEVPRTDVLFDVATK